MNPHVRLLIGWLVVRWPLVAAPIVALVPEGLSVFLPKVKTEEGYSADIYPWRYMSALCPHNILRRIFVSRGRCCADIYLQGYMSAQCPHYILLRFSALVPHRQHVFMPDFSTCLLLIAYQLIFQWSFLALLQEKNTYSPFL